MCMYMCIHTYIYYNIYMYICIWICRCMTHDVACHIALRDACLNALVVQWQSSVFLKKCPDPHPREIRPALEDFCVCVSLYIKNIYRFFIYTPIFIYIFIYIYIYIYAYKYIYLITCCHYYCHVLWTDCSNAAHVSHSVFSAWGVSTMTQTNRQWAIGQRQYAIDYPSEYPTAYCVFSVGIDGYGHADVDNPQSSS